MTQSAVSKQIKNLEQDLGCQLFYRTPQQIYLTDIGKSYYLVVASALKKITTESKSIRDSSNKNEITIIATIAVAHYWLFPRVALFKTLFPHININIYSSDEINAESCLSYDLGILYGHNDWNVPLHAHHLFPERIYAICGTSYPLKAKQTDLPHKLLEENLLHLDPHKWRWNNWQDWFSHFSIDYRQPAGALVMNNFPLLLQATIANMGVALGWGFAIDELIKNSLVKKASDYYYESTASDYLVYSKQRELSPAATAFRDWIIAGLDQSAL